MDTMIESLLTTRSKLEIGQDQLDRMEIHVKDALICARVAITQPRVRELGKAISKQRPGNNHSWTHLVMDHSAAIFFDTFLIRYLDWNDTYLSKEPAHPSDMMAAIFHEAGQMSLVNPRKILRALYIGYFTIQLFCDFESLRSKNADHVNYTMIGTVMALSDLLGLSDPVVNHALSIAITSHVSLRSSRIGGLSDWKAGATAESAKMAYESVHYAMAGFTGPDEPFSGTGGLFPVLGIRPQDKLAVELIHDRKLTWRFSLKKWPVEYHAQTAVEAASQIYALLGPINHLNISCIKIFTHRAAKDIIAQFPIAWHPLTRETADHSLPFSVILALVNGTVNVALYETFPYHDLPAIYQILLARTEVIEQPEYTDWYPNLTANRVVVEGIKGTLADLEIRASPGHFSLPVVDSWLDEKMKIVNFDNSNELDIVSRFNQWILGDGDSLRGFLEFPLGRSEEIWN